MDRDDLRDFVRDTVTVSTSEVDTALLDSYLDEGFGKVAGRAKWPFLVEELHLTLPSFSDSLTLPYPVLDVMSVITDVRKLRELSFPRFRTVEATQMDPGVTRYFAFRTPDRLYFNPAPDYNMAFRAMVHRSLTFPEAEQKDGIPWDEAFHTLIADWALYRVWQEEEDLESAAFYFQAFEDGIGKMVDFYGMSSVSAPPPVTASRGGK